MVGNTALPNPPGHHLAPSLDWFNPTGRGQLCPQNPRPRSGSVSDLGLPGAVDTSGCPRQASNSSAGPFNLRMALNPIWNRTSAAPDHGVGTGFFRVF